MIVFFLPGADQDGSGSTSPTEDVQSSAFYTNRRHLFVARDVLGDVRGSESVIPLTTLGSSDAFFWM